MIDNSEKCKHQLAFELWSSCVYEKRSNSDCILTNSFFQPPYPWRVHINETLILYRSLGGINPYSLFGLCQKNSLEFFNSP